MNLGIILVWYVCLVIKFFFELNLFWINIMCLYFVCYLYLYELGLKYICNLWKWLIKVLILWFVWIW